VDIVVTGRHIQVSERFRAHLDDRLAKVAQMAPKVSRVDVVVTHERTARNSEFVELTCRDRGSIVRAEAASEDKYNALDQAVEKLLERLRVNGRVRLRVRGAPRRGPAVAAAPAREEAQAAPVAAPPDQHRPFELSATRPLRCARRSTERAHDSGRGGEPMELVGHDFYLFNDADTGRASVVYRRRGWSYGSFIWSLQSHDTQASG
jgi:ribosomal subunit interface protein